MGAQKGHENRVVSVILQDKEVAGWKLPAPHLPLGHPFPWTGDVLTAELSGPGSGLPFSSSSWIAVARMGTLWERDM